MRLATALVSWVIAAWMCFIFLGSLPYKFTNHPDTQHIFSTIGSWMSGILGDAIGSLFTQFGAYAVGAFELTTALVLLIPALLWVKSKVSKSDFGTTRMRWHQLGGLMASAVMAGAVFFHLFTPLGIEVLHQGESDGGSLFRAAVSILILGFVLFFINRAAEKNAA